MKKFLRTLVLAALFMPLAVNAQSTVTIGDLENSTADSYLPMNSLYDYSYSQQIYTSDEIGVGGTITSITLWMYGNADLYEMPLNIYMLEVERESFTSSTDWEPVTAADIVYSGSVTVHNTADSAFTFSLDVPFSYSGTGNLLICFDNNTGLWKGGLNGKVFLADDGEIRAIYARRDGTDYDPTDMSGITASGTVASRNVISIDIIPSGGSQICEKPAAIAVSGITANEATINWASTVAGTYQFEYKATVDTEWTEITMYDTTYSLTDLTPNTTYNVRVKAICGVDFESGYKSTNFTTPCGSETLPFTENFDENLNTNPCWNGATGTTAEEVFNGASLNYTANTAWTYSSTTSNGLDAGHYRVNIYGTTCKKWMFTPVIDLTDATSPLLTFFAAFTKYSGTAVADGDIEDDKFMVIVSTDGGQTWDSTNAIMFNLNSLASTSYMPQFVDLSSYVGNNVRIAFYAESTVSGGDNNLHIDNITIEESTGELCMPVSNIVASNITAHEVTLTWEGEAVSYSVYDMNDPTVELYNTTDNTIVIEGLTSETLYDLGVVANCNTSSSVMINVTFTTQISCPAPTGLTATLTPGDGTVATLTWNENGTADTWQLCIDGDTNNIITVNDTIYDLTNLTPEQSVTAMVRAYCDVDDQSAWTNTITFTPTNAYMITVNEGTATNSMVPVYGLWTDGNSNSQFIIPATDLESLMFGNITKLTFYASNANISWGAASFTVYMTETSETTLSGLVDWNTMQQVYAGSLAISNNTMEIDFATPYLYMGGNLMIGINEPENGTYSSCNWYGVAAESGASVGGYGGSASAQSFLPKTTINFIPGEMPSCMPVSDLTVTEVTGNSVSLAWSDENNSGATYTIYNGEEVVATGVSGNSYTVTGLAATTGYTFGVVANCSATDASNMASVNATTGCEGGNCDVYIYAVDSYGDGWNGAAINVLQNGVSMDSYSMPGQGVSSTAIYDTAVVSVCANAPISFSWTSGSYDYEASFEIANSFGEVVYTQASGSELTSGEVFFAMASCEDTSSTVIIGGDTLYAEACDFYEWNDELYTESGVYTNGNDVLVLTINYSNTVEENVVASCSYEWNGEVYTESGIYEYTVIGENGCEETYILNLTLANGSVVFDTVWFVDTVETVVTVHDTVYAGGVDTVYIENPVHDTVYVGGVDTVYIENTVTVYDTVFVGGTDTVTVTETIVDTLTVTEYIHDTLYITEYIHDTIFITDTVYVEVPVDGVDRVDVINAKVYVSEGQIVVEGAEGNDVMLFDVTGRMLDIKRDDYNMIRFEAPVSGSYLIKIGNHPARRVVVVR